MQIHSPGQKVITFVSVRSGATQPEAASSPPAPRVEVTPSESDRTNVAPARGSPHNNNHHTAASLVEATQRRNDFLQNDLSKSDHNGGSGEAGRRGSESGPRNASSSSTRVDFRLGGGNANNSNSLDTEADHASLFQSLQSLDYIQVLFLL